MNSKEYASIIEAQDAIDAELRLVASLRSYWCSVTGREEVDHDTITIIRSYVDRFGMESVLMWIKRANQRCRAGADDIDLGKYISGIVRRQVEVVNEFDIVEGDDND